MAERHRKKPRTCKHCNQTEVRTAGELKRHALRCEQNIAAQKAQAA